ncbi:MAG: hypothetical protein IJR97_03525 [Clostridia bacterium]|nr:hypothetical protein [Clostridia bacterium]
MPIRKICAVLLFLSLLLTVCAHAEETAEEDTRDKYEIFFDHTVFLGDSVTTQLRTYAREKKLLPGAKFLCVTNYNLGLACRTSLNDAEAQLTLRGMRVTTPEGLKMLQAEKVFILLGLNDHAGSNLTVDMERYSRIIDHIRKVLPDVMIVAQTVTPIQKRLQGKTLNQENMNSFNEALEALCAEKGVYFLDIASPLKDEEGFLNTAYARDRSDNVHLNDAGLKVWTDTLYAFTDALIAQDEALTGPGE